MNDDELARAGRDAADVLRASLRARQADMEGLVVNVRQVATMWEERESSMAALLNEIAANLPGSAVSTPDVPVPGAGPMRMRPQ